MKILHILDHSLPLHSGYSFRSQNIFRAQRTMGFDPVVLTSPKHEQSWKGVTPEKETINDFSYYRSGVVSGNGLFPFGYELKLIKRLTNRLKEIIEIEKPDILHAHSPFLNGMAALNAASKFGIPVVYEIRAFWEDAAVDHGTFKATSLKYKLIKAMETRVCRKVSHATVLCNGLKNDLISRGIPEQKITPVFNGVSADDFKPCEPDNEFQTEWSLHGKKVIGFIGSFYRYEGLDLLIRAFHRIAEKFPHTVLLLVGGGEMEEELKDLACQLDNRPQRLPTSRLSGPSDFQALRSRVIIPGRIPHEKIPGIYALIDVLVYPRYSMRLTELVTPLKPLEAMAMGKALIASDVGGHHELIQNKKTGLLFPAGDENLLTETLEKVLIDDNLKKRIQNEAYHWVRDFHGWDKTTEVYRDIYKNGISASQHL